MSFAGIPMGHEFTSLEGDYEFTTYMSLSCQNCPTVVQALNTMSVINPRIQHTAVEGSLFQDEVEEQGILSVPTIHLDGEHFGQGRTTIEEFVARLDTGAEARAAALEQHVGSYGIDVIKAQSATELVPAGQEGGLHTVKFGEEAALQAREIVLATGAQWRLMGVPGES